MKKIEIINTCKEYEQYKNSKFEKIINSSIIKEIKNIKNSNIIGMYISDFNDITDIIAYINYYKFKRVIIDCKNIENINFITSIIDKNINIEIEVDNTISEDDMHKIYSYISSSSRDIGICANMISSDNSRIFKVFRSFITTIDINNSIDKEKCINDSKIIHFDGEVICTDDRFSIKNISDKHNNQTIYSLISDNITEYSDKELFTFISFDNPSFEVNYTYKEFNNRVNAASKSLIKSGIKKGSHVALWMNSIPQWFIYFFAITKIGAIAVPINKDNREYDMEHILRTNDIEMLIMSSGHAKNRYMDTIKKLIPEINTGMIKSKNFPHLKNIVTIGFSKISCISHEEFIKNGEGISDSELKKIADNVYNDDIAIILPTSGTTGKPKGVMLTHESIIHNGTHIGNNLELGENDIMGIIVTMFHCFGITLSMIAAMTHKSKMVIPEVYIKPYDATMMIYKYGVTCLNGAPKHFEGLMEAYEKFIDNTKCKITSLKKGIMAGANCSSKLMDAVEKIFEMNVISVYGQTELAPGDTMLSVSDDKYIRHNTVGKKFDYVDIKVVDDNNNEVVDGTMGEIVVKSPDIMVGYYGDLKATQDMYDDEGYFHSGDLAIKDDKYYKIVDRKKNMIIRNGENIQPMEVEEAIKTITGVKKACVFGVNIDESKNQAVVAAIVTDNQNITSEFIIQELKSKIAGYKIPSKIYFVNDFEYNANGKIVISKQIEACKKIEAKKLIKTLRKGYNY